MSVREKYKSVEEFVRATPKKYTIPKEAKQISDFFGTSNNSVGNAYMTPKGDYLYTPNTGKSYFAEHSSFAEEILPKLKGGSGYSGKDMAIIADMMPIMDNGRQIIFKIYSEPTPIQLKRIQG